MDIWKDIWLDGPSYKVAQTNLKWPRVWVFVKHIAKIGTELNLDIINNDISSSLGVNIIFLFDSLHDVLALFWAIEHC